MALEAWSLTRPNIAAISAGTSPLQTYYTGDDIHFHFPYAAFQWLPLFSPPIIHLIVAILAGAGMLMALGLFYRFAAVAVFLAWGYLFAVESTRSYWQSHYYIELLFTFLMMFIPAARRYSLDAWLARKKNPPRTVPFWCVAILRAQLVIAYFYAGVAKINADWLLDAVPVRWFLARKGVTAPFAPYLSSEQLASVQAFLQSSTFAYFISWTGLFFDLAVGFMFLFRRTRIFALVCMFIFHGTNHLLIFDDIDWFPLVGLLTSFIFLDPDWPERFWRWVRQPRFNKPDWKWFTWGALLLPPVGATLGWKLKPSPASGDVQAEKHSLWKFTPHLVAAWIVFQTFLPLRHYLIPGDGRFNYEGLSFSWRLKADTRHGFSPNMYLRDAGIIATSQDGRFVVNWNEWKDQKIIFRQLNPAQVDWSLLPEIVVILEPLLGQRIIYNPLSGQVRPESEARMRLEQTWKQLYGTEPPSVERMLPLGQAVAKATQSLDSAGYKEPAATLSALLPELNLLEKNQLEADRAWLAIGKLKSAIKELSRDTKAIAIAAPALRSIEPFGLEGIRRPNTTFLLVQADDLFDRSGLARKVDPGKWRQPDPGRLPRSGLDLYQGAQPLVIYSAELGPDSKELLPQYCIFDLAQQPHQPPFIWWNILKDVSPSKFLHLSNQPFYLRRYARRVAALWEKQYGRRPAVQATTMVSFNGRPHQRLVKTEADLASVGVRYFGHNWWIEDLQLRRLPREAVTAARGIVGD